MDDARKERGAQVSRRSTSLAVVFGLTATLVVLLSLAAGVEGALLTGASSRARALWKIGGAVAAELLLLAAILYWFRRRDERPFEHGPWEPGRRRAWVAAAAVWAVWCLPLILSPPAGAAVLEPSLFNAVGSLLAGAGAGIAEEWLFRGVVIALLARGGWGATSQLVWSSLLFGGAHVGWGAFAGDPMAVLVPIAGTTVLGLVFGGVYLLAGRRLLPAVALHAAIDLVIEPWLVLASVEGTLIMPGS